MSEGLTITMTKKDEIKFLVGLTRTVDLENEIGTLSCPSKMPAWGWSTPAEDCIRGSKLAKVKNSICSICYARKGRYVFPNVQKALKKRLKAWRWSIGFQSLGNIRVLKNRNKIKGKSLRKY